MVIAVVRMVHVEMRTGRDRMDGMSASVTPLLKVDLHVIQCFTLILETRHLKQRTKMQAKLTREGTLVIGEILRKINRKRTAIILPLKTKSVLKLPRP
jgi:hypothetical protein